MWEIVLGSCIALSTLLISKWMREVYKRLLAIEEVNLKIMRKISKHEEDDGEAEREPVLTRRGAAKYLKIDYSQITYYDRLGLIKRHPCEDQGIGYALKEVKRFELEDLPALRARMNYKKKIKKVKADV